ncbi:serine hydrolase [Streptomyces prasinosporus]|uniref:Serine hydrolase n=1 Tax=Streptomyces prasinosporus TaxID=68256 RepID=A0ABP6TM64_9ACTN
MPDGQLDGTHEALRRSGPAALRPRALTACAAAAVAVALAACSPAGPLDEVRASPARGNPPAAALAAPPPENLGATLARALAPVPRRDGTRLAVAVLDLDSADREIASYRGDAPFTTASVSKVGILAALLLRAQDEGRDLTAEEHRAAEAMITASDNHAAGLLWRAIGGREGLDAANERLGLSSTRGGPGIHWGLTRTTAKDQVRLLRAVFARGPADSAGRSREGLDRSSRAYIRELMGDVMEDQAWGVSAASPRWALKNGWLQRTATGLWVVNSIGQVTVHGHRYLLSVLSSGNASMESGVSLVERAARAAVGAGSAHVRPWPQ